MLADINVTPFVDILLIVLIAFIISAPLITRSLPIELPQGNLRQENPENQTGNMVVAVDQNEKIFFQEKFSRIFRKFFLEKRLKFSDFL